MARKKLFRKVPKFILNKINNFKKQRFVVAAVDCFPMAEIINGKFKKFGISYDSNQLVVADKFIPRPSFGKHSRENKCGKIVVRKDLPMITKTFSIEVPNYGDWSKGSHEIDWDRKVYRKDKIEPRNLLIFPEIVDKRENEVVVGFKINKTLNKSDKNFQKDVLFHLNLIQENFGKCDIIPVGETLKERRVYRKLNWEVLPPGWWTDGSQVQRVKERLGPHTQLFIERIRYIESLDPLERYEGQSYLGSRLYYVFVFEKCVLAECPMFGNAIYILDRDRTDSWQDIFAKTKKEVLETGVKRVLHRGDWKRRLKGILS